MSFSAQSLMQARDVLEEAARQKMILLRHIREQGRKIADLEREVQKQTSMCATAQQMLCDARSEIKALRAQIPDEATQRAFDDLVQYLTAPSEMHPELRMAA
jgi:septal ring factor EnvC (AmiA/AmiB activator)